MSKVNEISYKMGVLRYNVFSSKDEEQIENFSSILEILDTKGFIDGQVYIEGYTDELMKKGSLLSVAN